MIRKTLKNSPFHRIGNKYGHLIDTDHFLGRDIFQDTWIAPSDVVKEGSRYDLEIAFPGFSKDEIKMEIDGPFLRIKAGKKSNGNRSYLREAIPKVIEKTIGLDNSIDTEKIEAKLEKGILKVLLPIKENKKQGVEQIEVQ
ncbi:Hsp20/alpha crystallin family protein [Reichenbachiella sp. MALMAid0571]|uniref:Hsp20/alpha crystallin family protein n=1 Tax=Reichenbachiella sp. MALMAid0571 TaxID=3143939 RepID=UPI0032E0342B